MASYDEAVRKRIKKRWEQYKQEAGMSQTKAAKALGMNQSAFGQYLRGDIPLNTEFVQKFANLTDTDFDELNIKVVRDVQSVTLDVKATLSGRMLEKTRKAIDSVVPVKDSFLVEVDYRNHFLPKGTYLVVDNSGVARAGDTVIAIKDSKQLALGILEQTEDGWVLVEHHFFGARNHPLAKHDTVYRVAGFHLPEGTGATRES